MNQESSSWSVVHKRRPRGGVGNLRPLLPFTKKLIRRTGWGIVLISIISGAIFHMKTDSDLFEMIAHQTFWSWVIFRLSSVVAGLYFRFTDSEKKERICAIVWVSLASILFLYVVLYVVPFGA